MTVHVRKLMLPTDPSAKADTIERNRRLGWHPVPGISDHEMGTILQCEGPVAPPLYVPARPALRRTRPSGWVPFWIVLATPFVAGAALAVWR